MRLIRKKSSPESLIRYQRQIGASYDEMDAEVKKELTESLIDEQFGVCAYCQQKLNVDLQKLNKTLNEVSIEHHCERSICNGKNGTIDKRLDYKNLFVVCPGKGGNPTGLHCDTQKSKLANNPAANGLPMNFIPTNTAHISTIKYSSTGAIFSSNQLYDSEIKTILNINLSYLKEMRKLKWLRIFKNSRNRNRTINKVKMAKLIEKDLALKDGEFSNHFPGMSEYMQSKFC